MDTKIRKLTISISSSMELELDMAKRGRYRESTRNDMIKDLIVRGLVSFNAGKEPPRETY